MKLIAEREICLTPEDEKTSKKIPFVLEGKTKKLIINYSYSPKELDDKEKAEELIKQNLLRDAGDDAAEYTDYEEFMPLKNLVTLSLESPSGYVGAAHRQASSQHHEIGPDFASPGFIKNEVQQGQWNLFLDIHAIVTQSCSCKLKIEAEEGNV